MNQKLVTRKNRKVRRLRELHPDVKVKVLYLRDYQHLLVKYGLDSGESSPAQSGETSEAAGEDDARSSKGRRKADQVP